MPRIPPLLAQAVLVGSIACATAWGWIVFTGTSALSPVAVPACTCISVAVALLVEALARRVRRGRPRRAHARPRPDTRKAL